MTQICFRCYDLSVSQPMVPPFTGYYLSGVDFSSSNHKFLLKSFALFPLSKEKINFFCLLTSSLNNLYDVVTFTYRYRPSPKICVVVTNFPVISLSYNIGVTKNICIYIGYTIQSTKIGGLSFIKPL